MTLFSAQSAEQMIAKRSVSAEDIGSIRRAFYEDGQISSAEAELMFKINDAVDTPSREWADCFVEVLTDYVVEQAEPQGYVTAENSKWLLERIRASGHINSKTELELLVNVIDKARWCPECLVVAALDEVKFAVKHGEGPLRNGKTLNAGQINDAEVELLRRILYAYGGDGNIAITRREAEILFEIDAATQNAEHSEGWQDLFVKAISNSVMAASGYTVPCREQALARQAWLERRGDLSLGNMVTGMASGGLSGFGGFFGMFRKQSALERAVQALERQKIEIITAERIEPCEAEWLIERIFGDEEMSPNERALVDFLKANSPTLAPAFEAKFGRSTAAA